MVAILWMTIDRHPESLRNLIRERLADTGWEVYEVSYDSIHDLRSVPLERIGGVFLAPARHFPAEYMDRLRDCKLMQIWSAGYDKFNFNEAHARGIPVANNHGSNAISVAEHTMLMLLGLSRRLPEMHQRVIEGNWAGNDHGMSSHSLSGKTLGIIGLGNIGSMVASRAEAMGMRIIFSDPGIAVSPSPQWTKCDLSTVLEEADYISLHIHLHDSTRNILNSENLRSLTKQPFLINVSRAELINRDALIEALRDGSIKGVAMDAHYSEPSASTDPLFGFPQVLFSPHVAGSTVESYEFAVDSCIRNLRLAFSGSVSAVKGQLTRD